MVFLLLVWPQLQETYEEFIDKIDIFGKKILNYDTRIIFSRIQQLMIHVLL